MKILCVSLGCDKNLVDTEMMLGLLNKGGHTFTDNEQDAEIVIVNTCSFITDAKEESIHTILEMAKLKETANCKALIVTGCLAQRYKQELLDEIPEVDGILGTSTYDEIVNVLTKALEGTGVQCFHDLDRLPDLDVERIITTGGHYAYLKISEGCDKNCTYCIIPSLRGKYRSVPMERLIRETQSLASKGVKELILVAQETTLYGLDLYGEKSLHKLLEELCKVSGIQWIRIHYCYPEEITEELIAVMAREKKICHYLDMPIQHASDPILKRMNRRTNQAQLKDVIGRLRDAIPDIAIRTTLISGFPGETDSDHESLMEFIDEMEFERLGVFAYSEEEGTPAATFENQISQEVKEERRSELMELQQEIAWEKSASMTGKVVEVMIEGKVADESAYVGRTYMDAPNVDGLIFVQTDLDLMSGDFVLVKVTGSQEYDLIGEVFDEFAQ